MDDAGAVEVIEGAGQLVHYVLLVGLFEDSVLDGLEEVAFHVVEEQIDVFGLGYWQDFPQSHHIVMLDFS